MLLLSAGADLLEPMIMIEGFDNTSPETEVPSRVDDDELLIITFLSETEVPAPTTRAKGVVELSADCIIEPPNESLSFFPRASRSIRFLRRCL